MTNQSAASQYQQGAARTASPVGRVVALFDTVLRDFHRAQEAMQAGDIEKRVYELNHAITVITHLKSVLDHQRGGEAAKRFDQFYEVTRLMILDASVLGKQAAVKQLIELYRSLRQAWKEVETKIPGEPASAPSVSAQKPPTATPPPSPSDDLTPASSGRWSA